MPPERDLFVGVVAVGTLGDRGALTQPNVVPKLLGIGPDETGICRDLVATCGSDIESQAPVPNALQSCWRGLKEVVASQRVSKIGAERIEAQVWNEDKLVKVDHAVRTPFEVGQ